MSNPFDPDTLKLLETLSIVYSGGAVEKEKIDAANTILQNFQTSRTAWAACVFLLGYPQAATPPISPAARIFAAQTIRSKVTYDLSDLHEGERASLFVALQTSLSANYLTGPRVIVIQICLSLAGLVLQMSDGPNVMLQFLSTLFLNPQGRAPLLTFLTVLPEEITTNTRIPISDQDYQTQEELLLVGNASRVLEMLKTVPRDDPKVHEQILLCLRSWINAGVITPVELSKTDLFALVFTSLESEALFDTAVDLVCDIIHETQEIDDNMPVIEMIVPQLVALKSALPAVSEDAEKMRGFCRILAEAGETYRGLILHHPDTFYPIVDAIAMCTACSDLEIVAITFNFWYRLAQSIGKRQEVNPIFLDAYKNLAAIMIRHLHFPADGVTVDADVRDAFRAFRHRMGDTLKDCCYVLGTSNCLMFTYDLIAGIMSRAAAAGVPPAWQEIEAPLFSMRSMGAEVDLNDDEVMPKIMDLIPLLPTHPRIRYAAILVISRYSEWVDRHDGYIQFNLSYVTAGFEDADEEVAAAAGQAMKYLCKDCKRHLAPYLDQLYTFVHTVNPTLAQVDRLQIYEAIAYVISSLPMDQAARALRKFSFEVIEKIHAILSKPTPASPNELQAAQEGLEQLEVMLGVVQTFGEDLPEACQNTCMEAWIVFDNLLIKYGAEYNVADRACRVIRLGLQFFSVAALPTVPAVLSRMTAAFQSSGHSSYIWIVGKAVGYFGRQEPAAFRDLFKTSYEQISTSLFQTLQTQSPRSIPDVMEDYVHFLLQLVDHMPDILFLSEAFPTAFQAALTCLELPSDDILFAALDLIRNIVGHDSVYPTDPSIVPPPKFPLYAQAIREAVGVTGPQAIQLLINGLVSSFSQDMTPLVMSIILTFARLWPEDLASWMVDAVAKLPPNALPPGVAEPFLADFTTALRNADADKVKVSLHNIHRASRKFKDRKQLRDRDRDLD